MRPILLKYIIIKVKFLILLIVSSYFAACNRSKYTQFDANYSYFLKYKSPNTEVLAQDQIIIYQMQLAKANDSIFWDSQYFTSESFSFILNSKQQKSSFETMLSASFSEKDSIILQCNATALFNDFFKKPLPYFLKSTETIIAYICIDTVISPVFFERYREKRRANFNPDSEKNAIAKYLKSNAHKFYKNANIYMTKLNNNVGKQIKKGDLLSVKYNGYFLNGTSCDNNGGKAIDFEYGEQSQLLPGIMKAISLSQFEDSISIIIPSAMAYGDSGSSNGFIKPYTALRYEMTIKKIK